MDNIKFSIMLILKRNCVITLKYVIHITFIEAINSHLINTQFYNFEIREIRDKYVEAS